MIERAREEALRSPCAKSNRGVVIFQPRSLIGPRLHGAGFNGPPEPFTCDGSDACRRDCNKVAVHAERRALDEDLMIELTDLSLELVHVKVVNGAVVPGGPPSCWQCSRDIVEAKLAGVWLFETIEPACPSDQCAMCTGESCNICAENYGGEACDHDVIDRHRDEPESPAAAWKFYTAVEFHRATLFNCNLHTGATK